MEKTSYRDSGGIKKGALVIYPVAGEGGEWGISGAGSIGGNCTPKGWGSGEDNSYIDTVAVSNLSTSYVRCTSKGR